MNISFPGKKVIVTGAAHGFGRAIALAFAARGAEVWGCDILADELAETAGLATSAGGWCQVRPVDVRAKEAVFAFVAEVMSDDRPVDILVNNAGIIRRADATDFTEADWDAVMDVNLKALFFTTQAFARAVLARQGQGNVVNIASLLSFQGGIRVPSYTASKHGVAGLTKLLANEWAMRGINVNAVAPGYIETNNTEALRNDPDRNQAILDRIPAGRWGQAEDIAGAAVFLCTPAARYVHGAVLNVDGGWLAR